MGLKYNKECEALHGFMWGEMAKLTDDQIKEALEIRKSVFGVKRYVLKKWSMPNAINGCYACEATGFNCDKCPLDWTQNGKFGPCFTPDSIFKRAERYLLDGKYDDFRERCKYIAEMKWSDWREK